MLSGKAGSRHLHWFALLLALEVFGCKPLEVATARPMEQKALAGSCSPITHEFSAARCPEEDYRDSANRRRVRVERPLEFNAQTAEPEPESEPASAYAVRRSFGGFSAEWVTATLRPKQIREAFTRVRDDLFLPNPNASESFDLKRRPSFLYPDDGCWIRSELMLTRGSAYLSHQIFGTDQSTNSTPPELFQKVYLFGNLSVQTKNNPRGAVNWWYHTAPVVRSDDEVYVLDPALEPGHPLRIQEWVSLQSADPASTQISICGSATYGPMQTCEGRADHVDSASVQSDQSAYLIAEWERQLELGRDPKAVLGNSPPWIMGSEVTVPAEPSPTPTPYQGPKRRAVHH